MFKCKTCSGNALSKTVKFITSVIYLEGVRLLRVRVHDHDSGTIDNYASPPAQHIFSVYMQIKEPWYIHRAKYYSCKTVNT